jgi:hypothetical protein
MYATMHDDSSMIPELDESVVDGNLLPSFLKEQKLEHFIPKHSPR